MRKAPRQIVRSKRGTVLGGKSEAKFSRPINLPKVKPRESMQHFWHPNRAGVEFAPPDFLRRLQEMNPDLHCCRPPGNAPVDGGSAWLLWYKRARVTHPLCPGWLLLFAWRNDAGVPQQLDERVFAVLYGGSALKHGDGATYFKRCIEEKIADAKKARDRAYTNHRKAKQRELVTSRRINNLGSGSKFARHHDGSVVPSRGSLNWHLESRRRILPPELIKAEDEQREAQRAAAADAKTKIRQDLGIRLK